MTYSPIPKWTITDTNGEPVVAGTLYFYEAGTTTPKNVYSDTARSVSLGAELTTDSYGQVGPVYLDTEAATKVVAKDSAGATLWTIDNLTPPSGASGVVGGGGIARATCPLDYGAIGDGSADESTEVQSAIDDATGEVDLAGKTYRCDSQIVLRSGITLKNGTLDFSSCTDAYCVGAVGGLGSSDAVTVNAYHGDESVTITDTSGYSAGDVLFLGSSTQHCTQPATSTNGELIRIKTVDSGTVLSTTSNLVDNYTLAPVIRSITTVSNIRINGVKIIAAQASTQSGIYISYGDGCVVSDCIVDGAYTAGVHLLSCMNCTVENTTITDSQNGSGILVSGVSQGVSVNSCHIDNAPVGVTVGGESSGVCRLVSVVDCSISGCTDAGVKLLGDSHICTVSACSVIGGEGGASNGIVCYGDGCVISGNTVRQVDDACIDIIGVRKTSSDGNLLNFVVTGNNLSEGRFTGFSECDGIVVTNNASTTIGFSGGIISDNIVSKCDRGVVVIISVDSGGIKITDNSFSYVVTDAIDFSTISGASSDDIDISGNNVEYVQDGDGINISVGGSSTNYRISNNSIDSFKAYGIFIANSTGYTLRDVVVAGNILTSLRTPTVSSLYIRADRASDLTDFIVKGNRISSNTTAHGVEIYGPDGFVVSDNIVERGVYIDSVTNTSGKDSRDIVITGNKIDDGSVACLQVNASADNSINNVVISNNYCVASSTYAILVSSATTLVVDGVVICGNIVESSGTGSCVFLSSADADGVLNASICGNSLRGENDIVVALSPKNLSITGNNVYTDGTTSAPNGIEVETANGCVISGNVVRNDDTTNTPGCCILISGSVCTDVLVSGNTCIGGHSSILETVTTPSKLMAHGNLMTGYGGGGNLVGTWTLGVASSTAGNFYNGI